MTESLELDDVQGLIARGYPELKAAGYLVLEIDDASAARRWLASLIAQVTPAPAHPADRALNIGFTVSGLKKLGQPEEVTNQFSNEFTAGMTTPHRRRMFGDVEASAPENWAWGGPSTPTPDVMLLVFARDVESFETFHSELAGAYAGVSEIKRLDAFTDLGGKEHFGFADGISQPTIDGLSGRKDIPPNTIRAGEFILGYLNEYGQYTDRPLLPVSADPQGILPMDAQGSGSADLGRNGTYLVFRQLAQDVDAFWRYLDVAAGGDAIRRTWLAARMVGRWPGGAPVTLPPDADDPMLASANDFTYQYADAFGLSCPIGAHVRRSHPRDSLDPSPGTARSVQLDKRHRLLRRGREYGPATSDGAERGLYFLCLGANIGRQFEFVQHSWVNNPKFEGLYDEPDPLVGYHSPGFSNFSIPTDPVRVRLKDIPQFVTTRGGAYFFLPGVRALKFLTLLA
jgi:Dyp-type peroxidase family